LCLICGQRASELHHNRYARRDLLGKTISEINPICHPCHREIEFDDGKTKQPVENARKKFLELSKKEEPEDEVMAMLDNISDWYWPI